MKPKDYDEYRMEWAIVVQHKGNMNIATQY